MVIAEIRDVLKETGNKRGLIKKIIKRNGEIVSFDKQKIVDAIYKAAEAVGGHDVGMAKDVTDNVVHKLTETYNKKQSLLLRDSRHY